MLADEPSDAADPRLVERKLRVLKRVGQAVGAAGTLGGQAMDLELLGRVAGPEGGHRPVEADALRDMHARKTGALIRAAVTSGAIMAGGTPAQVEALDRYAAAVGLAFQIVDDILDVQSSSQELGKTAGKDAAMGKPTYPALYGLERSLELARGAVSRAQQALLHADVPNDHLMAIAQWAIERRS